MGRTMMTVALAGALATMSTLPVAADDFMQFRSPTGNIGCGYAAHVLRCDVIGGIVPLPPTPNSCQFDWGQGFWLHSTGKAQVVCAGDTALDHAAPVVAYGTTWKHGGFLCASSVNGFRCTNAEAHGFTIAKGEAHRF